MMRGNLVAWLNNSEIPASWKGAREFLAKRREARRAQPFVPIQEFGLSFDEKMTPPIDWTGGVKPLGEGVQTRD